MSEGLQDPCSTDIIWFHLHEVHRIVKLIEIENRNGLGRGGNEELLFNKNRVLVWDGEKFWRWSAVMVVQLCDCT